MAYVVAISAFFVVAAFGMFIKYDTSAQHSNRRHPERINIVMMKEVLRTGAREAPTDASEQRKAETSYVL